MKTILFNLKMAGMLLLVDILASFGAYGTNFTAVTSGNWSSSATWGGSAPSYNITTDHIIIPVGINVTMDNSVTFNGALSQLDVDGTLSSGSDVSLSITSILEVTGSGTINVDDMVLGAAATVGFTGSLVVNTLTSSALSLQLTADMMVNQTLTLAAGTLTMKLNGSLDMGIGSTIVISGGLLSLDGGTLMLTNPYNVEYIQGSAIAGLELSGSQLTDVTIDVTSGQSVTLTSDLMVKGILDISSGTLILNNYNLTVSGDIAPSGSGEIFSTFISSVTIETTGSPSGSIMFDANGNSVNNLNVNIGSGNSVVIESDLTIEGTLAFTGGNLDIGNHNITIGGNGSISGAGSASYIITGSSGHLSMQVMAGASVAMDFHVGTSSHYAPVSIQLNPGSSSGEVMVGVLADVKAEGSTGTDLSSTQPLVDISWDIKSDITANLDMDVEVMWSSAMEVNEFDRTMAYISHYSNGSWDMSAYAAATVQSNGMFSLERNNVTSLSLFAVFDITAVTAIAEKSIDSDAEINMYLNPTAGQIIITRPFNSKETFYIDICNVNGQLIERHRLNNRNYNIPINKLSKGNYVIKLYSNDVSVVKKFSKI